MRLVFLIRSIPFFIGILANAQAVSGPASQGGGPYAAGKGVSPPTLVSKTEPEYTDEARNARVESIVVTKLVVSEDGSPINIQRRAGSGFRS